MRAGELEWHDKMDLKHGYEELGVRVVPHAVARYGAYISPGAILMPSYVNIGAWVGAGTMVDTWATVGSCAQVGERVHLSGGVGVGGVLEPVQAAPVIIEDDVMIGANAVVLEGVRVGKGAVVAAGAVCVDDVPAGAVVAGVPARVIKMRDEKTDSKTGLEEGLRQL